MTLKNKKLLNGSLLYIYYISVLFFCYRKSIHLHTFCSSHPQCMPGIESHSTDWMSKLLKSTFWLLLFIHFYMWSRAWRQTLSYSKPKRCLAFHTLFKAKWKCFIFWKFNFTGISISSIAEKCLSPNLFLKQSQISFSLMVHSTLHD